MSRDMHPQRPKTAWRYARTSWRALVLGLVWLSAGLWDVAHALEHARDHHSVARAVEHAGDHHAIDPVSAVEPTAAASLGLAAGEGHAHSHPPDDPPVLGAGKGPEVDAAPILATQPALLIPRRPTTWASQGPALVLRRATVAAAGPRAPPSPE